MSVSVNPNQGPVASGIPNKSDHESVLLRLPEYVTDLLSMTPDPAAPGFKGNISADTLAPPDSKKTPFYHMDF